MIRFTVLTVVGLVLSLGTLGQSLAIPSSNGFKFLSRRSIEQNFEQSLQDLQGQNPSCENAYMKCVQVVYGSDLKNTECGPFKDFLSCVRDASESCPPEEKNVIQRELDAIDVVYSRMCGEQTEQNEESSRQFQCIDENFSNPEKIAEECAPEVMMSIIQRPDIDTSNETEMICLAAELIAECAVGKVEQTCGADVATILRILLKMAARESLRSICSFE